MIIGQHFSGNTKNYFLIKNMFLHQCDLSLLFLVMVTRLWWPPIGGQGHWRLGREAGSHKALRSRQGQTWLVWLNWVNEQGLREGAQAGRRAEQSTRGMRTVYTMTGLCGEHGPFLWLSRVGLIPKVIPVRQGARTCPLAGQGNLSFCWTSELVLLLDK